MAFHFCSLASGSSGNCYIIQLGETVLILDAGIAGKRVMAGLEALNIDIADVSAILLTHEHTDHTKSIRMIARKAESAEVYGTEGTFIGIGESKLPPDRLTVIEGGEDFRIADIEVKAFNLSHDALEPVSYSFVHDGRQLTVVTDTGFVSEEIMREMEGANTLVLEANHEVNVLRVGSYPFELQERILGDKGHLSNETAARCINKIMEARKAAGDKKYAGVKSDSDDMRNIKNAGAENSVCKSYSAVTEQTIKEDDNLKVILAHLSGENNSPEIALRTVENFMFEEDNYPGEGVELSVFSRSEPSPWIDI